MVLYSMQNKKISLQICLQQSIWKILLKNDNINMRFITILGFLLIDMVTSIVRKIWKKRIMKSKSFQHMKIHNGRTKKVMPTEKAPRSNVQWPS